MKAVSNQEDSLFYWLVFIAMVFLVSQIAVAVVADDSQLEQGLAASQQKVERWAGQTFAAPSLTINTRPAEDALKGVVSVASEQAKQLSQIAVQSSRSQTASMVSSARQAAALRLVDVKETEAAEREKVRTKGAADREALRTRVAALRAETAEARIQSAQQIKIARETERQREAIYRTIERSGQAAGNIGQSLTYGVSLPIFALGKAALDADVRMDSLRRGLIAVNGTAAAAEVQFQKLREVAKLPGLTLEQAVEGDIQLQAAGLSADQATRSLMAFGNALATVGKTGPEHLGLVNLALSQIASAPKVMGQDVRQLQQQLPQIRQAMLQAFGTADTETIQKMGIDPKVFIQKITDEFAKLPKVTGGVQNDIENAEDNINQSLSRIGQAIARVGSGPLQHFTDDVTHVSDEFSGLSIEGQDALIKIALGLVVGGPLLIGIGRVAEGVSSIRKLYLSLPAVAARSAAEQAASAQSAATATAAAAGEEAAATKAAGMSTLAMWGVGGLVMLALAGLSVELVALAGKWDDMKKAQDQAAESARNYAATLDSVKGQGERQALGAVNQQIGQEIADLKGALDAYRAAQKSGDPNPLNAYRGYLRETPEGNRYNLSSPAYNNPNFGQRRLDALMADQSKNNARVQAIVKAGLPVGIGGGTDQGAAAAEAAVHLQDQLDKGAVSFAHHCEALARTAQENGKTAYAAIMKGAGSATVALARFQARGLAQPFTPGMTLAPGGLLYSNTMGRNPRTGVVDGHVQTIGPNGERLDQYGKNHFKLSDFQYYVPPAGTKGGNPPPPPNPADADALQDLKKQYIEATQGKYAGERYQAGLDLAANKKIDPKMAAAVYRKALADIRAEELADQAAHYKKVETAQDKHHRQLVAAGMRMIRDMVAQYKQEVAIGKTVDAANALNDKNRSYVDDGSSAQFARERSNAQAAYASSIKNPYVDRKTAQAALQKTLDDIQNRSDQAQQERTDRATAKADKARTEEDRRQANLFRATGNRAGYTQYLTGQESKFSADSQEFADYAAKIQALRTALDGFNDDIAHTDAALRLQLAGQAESAERKWQSYLADHADLAKQIETNTQAATQAFEQFKDSLALTKQVDQLHAYNDQIGQLRQQMQALTARSGREKFDAANTYVDQDGNVQQRYDAQQTQALYHAQQAVDQAEQFRQKMGEVSQGLGGVLDNTFERLASGAKVSFKQIADDFKGMVIRMIAEAEAAKIASFVTSSNGLGGIIGRVFGGDPTRKKGAQDAVGKDASLPSGTMNRPTPVYIVGSDNGALDNSGFGGNMTTPGGFGTGPGGFSTGGGQAGVGRGGGGAFGFGGGGGGFGGFLSAGLAIYSAAHGGAAKGASTPPFAPTPGGAGGTDWLGTAASVAPMIGPQGAAVGAGLSILDMFTHKKPAAAAPMAGDGLPGGTSRATPVYIVGMAPGLGGAGASGGKNSTLGTLGGIAGIAASFLPGGSVVGKVLGGIGKIFHFAQGTASVPGMGATDTVPAFLTPGEVVLSRPMLSGAAPAPVLPTPFLTRQGGGGAITAAEMRDILASSHAARPVQINANQNIGSVSHEADENRVRENFGRQLEQLAATY